MPDLQLLPDADPPRVVLLDHLVASRFLQEQGAPAAARDAAEALLARVADRTSYRRVVEGDRTVGGVWLVEQGDDLAVQHLWLDDAARAAEVRTAVDAVARDGGARRVTVGVLPGDAVTEGLVSGGGFTTAAVQMRLELAGDLPGEDVVALQPMDEASYAVWSADEVATYAEERVQAGESRERALEVAREQHAELLPDGLATPDQHFFLGRVGDATVGTLWLGTERPMAFVYLVAVDEAHRRRGYGAGLMRAGALWARDRGAPVLGLNVFGYNHGARALYERLGYATVELYEAAAL